MSMRMKRSRKPLRAMFVSADGKISLHHIEESPAQLAGLARAWIRTGVDLKSVRGLGTGLFVYEQTPQEPLRSLAVAFQSRKFAEQLRRQFEASRDLQQTVR